MSDLEPVTTTGTPPFKTIRHLLSGKAPRRPEILCSLCREMVAWEKASEEALDNFQAQIETRAT